MRLSPRVASQAHTAAMHGRNRRIRGCTPAAPPSATLPSLSEPSMSSTMGPTAIYYVPTAELAIPSERNQTSRTKSNPNHSISKIVGQDEEVVPRQNFRARVEAPYRDSAGSAQWMLQSEDCRLKLYTCWSLQLHDVIEISFKCCGRLDLQAALLLPVMKSSSPRMSKRQVPRCAGENIENSRKIDGEASNNVPTCKR